MNVCPGVDRALPAAAPEPGGGAAVCVGARGMGFGFVPGRLTVGMAGTGAWVGSAENKWGHNQIRSSSGRQHLASSIKNTAINRVEVGVK